MESAIVRTQGNKKKEEKNTALEDYIYYVAMEYDENGLISNLSVRWNDADTLLKIVHSCIFLLYLFQVYTLLISWIKNSFTSPHKIL